MKKLFILLILTCFIISGCGTDNDQNNENTSMTPSATFYQDEDNNEVEKASAEITETVLNVWKDSAGTVWAHAAFEIENTGNTPVLVESIVLSFVGKDNSIIDTLSYLYSVPSIINPGQVGYCSDSTLFDGITKTDEIKNIEVNIDYTKTSRKVELYEVMDLKITDQSYGGIKVTGRVRNTTEDDGENVVIAVALYDSSNNLIGVMESFVETTLEAEKTIGFSTSYPDIDIESSQVSSMIGKAYNEMYTY